jgi:hypothetical protein
MSKQELLKEAKPISFNTEMVRAILDNRKTVTMRKIKNIPKNYVWFRWDEDEDETFGITDGWRILESIRVKPKYKTGDMLQVIEVVNDKEIPLEIFLKVTAVKVERMEDITEEEAVKEGFITTFRDGLYMTAKEMFLKVMMDIYGINDGYVYVYEFERIEVEK